MKTRDDFAENLRRAGIHVAEVDESFARSGGPGGQHVNKVSTAVTLRHRPSGITVTAQDSRSQATNRRLARERLIAAIIVAREEKAAARRASRERERRRKSPRPAKLKRQILEGKRKRAEIKQARSRVLE